MKQLSLISMLVLLAIALGKNVLAQDSNHGSTQLDRAAMQHELERLASICDGLQLTDEAATCRSWLVNVDRSDQQRLFLPIELPEESASDARRASWCRHFIAARRAHAQWLYVEAQNQAQQGDEPAAFRTLWNVLREDPEHVAARRVLGALANAVVIRPKFRQVTAAHPTFGWPPRSYSRVQTTHFVVTSRAEPKVSIDIAQRLEIAHALWSQLFYEQWAKPGQLSAKLVGDKSNWNETRKMEVVLLKDRNDYLEALGLRESNIGASVGYYNARAKQSFFYPSDDLEATFFHELTHQLFAEASRIDTLNDAGSQGGIWILEGIALYMESLRSQGTFWTVGGIDAPRMQTARYRAVRDGYWPAWNDFSSGTIDAWKEDAKVALYYSHAAGLTHAMLDLADDRTEARKPFMDALIATYEGRATASNSLLGQFASSEEAAKLEYQDRMTITDEQLSAFVASGTQVKELVLAGSDFEPQTWQKLAGQKGLQWLDLSFCNCTNSDLKWLDELSSLERLSVEGSAIDGGLLKQLGQLPTLSELDLSGCAIDDKAFAGLRGHRGLKILWLTGTQVTDEALEILATLPKLKSCEIGGTGITAEAWQKFLRDHPLESP